MEVILKSRIDRLGKALDIVQVKPGYARNYLFPRDLATIATREAKELIEQDIEKAKSLYLQNQQTAQGIIDRLNGLEINILVKVSDGEKLYGSVTGKEISQELNKRDFSIDAKQIRLENSIKTLGMHKAKVEVPPGLTASIKVWVVDETGKIGESPSAK